MTTTTTTFRAGMEVWAGRSAPNLIAGPRPTAHDRVTLVRRFPGGGSLWICRFQSGAETVVHESMMDPT